MNMHTIKGKEFREDTIVAALKANSDWPKEYNPQPGDVVKAYGGGIRIIVRTGGMRCAVDTAGRQTSFISTIDTHGYTKIGVITDYLPELPRGEKPDIAKEEPTRQKTVFAISTCRKCGKKRGHGPYQDESHIAVLQCCSQDMSITIIRSVTGMRESQSTDRTP